MKTMGKETRRMLCCLLAICLAAAAGFTVLLSYMANDYQKTMVEHDYGTAGYLVNHPDTNVAAAFTKDKTNSDLKAGKQVLKEAGYHENTDPRMVPAVAAYQKRTAVIMADEPTGNLDSKNSREVITLLKSMSAKYRQTILMITHNENHAEEADRVLRMTDGRLRDLGVAAR